MGDVVARIFGEAVEKPRPLDGGIVMVRVRGGFRRDVVCEFALTFPCFCGSNVRI